MAIVERPQRQYTRTPTHAHTHQRRNTPCSSANGAFLHTRRFGCSGALLKGSSRMYCPIIVGFSPFTMLFPIREIIITVTTNRHSSLNAHRRTHAYSATIARHIYIYIYPYSHKQKSLTIKLTICFQRDVYMQNLRFSIRRRRIDEAINERDATKAIHMYVYTAYHPHTANLL